jgi:hypothetical protein
MIAAEENIVAFLAAPHIGSKGKGIRERSTT